MFACAQPLGCCHQRSSSRRQQESNPHRSLTSARYIQVKHGPQGCRTSASTPQPLRPSAALLFATIESQPLRGVACVQHRHSTKQGARASRSCVRVHAAGTWSRSQSRTTDPDPWVPPWGRRHARVGAPRFAAQPSTQHRMVGPSSTVSERPQHPTRLTSPHPTDRTLLVGVGPVSPLCRLSQTTVCQAATPVQRTAQVHGGSCARGTTLQRALQSPWAPASAPPHRA